MRVLGDIPRLNARRYPEKKAVIMEGHQLTYGQLNVLVNRLAHGLLSLGVLPGDRVAIMAEDCVEFVIINYAVAKCGAVLVPLNFRYQNAEVVYVVNDSAPKLFFYESRFAGLIDETKGQFEPGIRLAVISGEGIDGGLTLYSLMDAQSVSEPHVRVDPLSSASIIYTSGTTGFPKGVLFSHASYFYFYVGMVVEGGLTHEDVHLISLPLFHNGGLNASLQPALMMGNTTVLMGRGFDPDRFLDTVSRHAVTVSLLVPTQLAMLVNHPNVSKYNVYSLQKIWYGSSPIIPTLLDASRSLFKADFYQWYGQTETGMVSVLGPAEHMDRAGCTGREMFQTEVRIIDKNGADTPIGEVGEIVCSQAPQGMIGYHKNQKATQEMIRDGWIHTGDVARVEGDGYFTIVSRVKDMIISGAENIYPKEIEDLIASHPSVQEVTVFGIPDDLWGESVCAAVVPIAGRPVKEDDIIEFCTTRLARYKKPKKVIFVETLPKNMAGKVTKDVLRQPFWHDRDLKI